MFFWSRRGPWSEIRIVGSANLELAGWELAAASRYGWRETKLRLALHLALLSPEQDDDDEDLSHVDDDCS